MNNAGEKKRKNMKNEPLIPRNDFMLQLINDF